MRIITAHAIKSAIFSMIKEASTKLSSDVYEALVTCHKQATSVASKEIFRQLIENADYAEKTGLPLCQDCGTAIFFVERGENVQIEGSNLNVLINEAMISAYEVNYLRKSMCHPLTRKNTQDNSPALIHTEVIEGESLKISFLAKGGGSENMSRCTMLTPSQGWQGIKEFVIQRIAESGANPCPPIVVGVGIGGTFDTAPIMAKKALLRPLNDRHSDTSIASLENELLTAINKLGIGPMGLGGGTTALGVKINMASCHIASLPLAVNIQCHSIRHREVVL